MRLGGRRPGFARLSDAEEHSGLVFGAPVGAALAEKFAITAHVGPPEILLMGSAAASMSVWWILGALVRIADRVGRDDTRGKGSGG